MGQSATLYRVSQAVFGQIAAQPEDVAIIEEAKEYITFEQTFEGIRFILSREQDEHTLPLVDQLFYPHSAVGQEDIEMDIEDIDFDKESINYHSPETVAEISELLDGMSEVQFTALYDAAELNRQGIYPSIWSDSTNPDQAFTRSHLLQDFTMLKVFFTAAKAEADYILCFVG